MQPLDRFWVRHDGLYLGHQGFLSQFRTGNPEIDDKIGRPVLFALNVQNTFWHDEHSGIVYIHHASKFDDLASPPAGEDEGEKI